MNRKVEPTADVQRFRPTSIGKLWGFVVLSLASAFALGELWGDLVGFSAGLTLASLGTYALTARQRRLVALAAAISRPPGSRTISDSRPESSHGTALGALRPIPLGHGPTDSSGSLVAQLEELARGRDEVADVARVVTQLLSELQDSRVQLTHATRIAAFGALGAGITHEVKNPITALVGFAQLAQKKLDSPDKVLELLHIIESEGLRCRDILSNFLKFARGSRDSWESIDINQIVQETVRVMYHQLTINGVRLDVRLGEGLPAVLANATELQQVIVNLTLNAQQATPAGGTVTIVTASDGAEVVITVGDTGCGIPDEVRQHLFEPFFTTKGASGGNGLGLAICASIVQSHHGTLTVDSLVGQGTTFTLRLPVAAADTP